MPLQYYHKGTLRSISNLIGTMEKIDYSTENANRGKFARLVIKIDLSKPLISRFKIDGKIQNVEYEDLPTICYSCGRFGHSVETCTFHENHGRGRNDTKEKEPMTLVVEESSITGPNLGPWMHAQ